MINGRGEHLWRPLANPSTLQISSFQDNAPQGFGLLQRTQSADAFQDFEARYEARPSLWVEPIGNWGEGAVVLTEIPTDAETNDNIVMFWSPKEPLLGGSEYSFAYRLTWGQPPQPPAQMMPVIATRRGRASVLGPTPDRLFVVDYGALPHVPTAANPSGQLEQRPKPVATVTTSAGQVRNVVVHDNPLTGGYRVTFEFAPQEAALAELRLELKFNDDRRAEHWIYRWTQP